MTEVTIRDTIATQTSPERLSLQSNTKSWRNANSPSVDKGVVAYGSALANWGIGAKPKHNIKKVGRNRKKKKSTANRLERATS